MKNMSIILMFFMFVSSNVFGGDACSKDGWTDITLATQKTLENRQAGSRDMPPTIIIARQKGNLYTSVSFELQRDGTVKRKGFLDSEKSFASCFKIKQ